MQPAWDLFAKQQPFVATGLEYSLPWHQVLSNTPFLLRFIYTMVTDKRLTRTAAYVQQILGGVQAPGTPNMWATKPEWSKIRLLVNSRKETEFPLLDMNDPARHAHTLTACGPIVMTAPSIQEAGAVDPGGWPRAGRVAGRRWARGVHLPGDAFSHDGEARSARRH